MVGMGDVGAAGRAADRTFNKTIFASTLKTRALPAFGAGKCASYVRQAMIAAGLDTKDAPFAAKDYGPFLMDLGFIKLPKDGYQRQVGDIIVINSIPGHPYGHVEGWSGTNWISDFSQGNLYPSHAYEKQGAYYEIFRR